MVTWVAFDLGNVVLQHTGALPALSRLLDVDPQAFSEAYFEHRPDYDRRSDASRYWNSIAAAAGSAEPDVALIQELVRLDDLGWNVADPETLELVDELHEAGLHLAVLSNAPSSMGRLVESQPWAAHFQRLYFSGDLGLVKPEPAIYRHLLDDLGATPAELAFLDDRSDNVEAAIQAGINGILFTDAARARAELKRIGLPLR